jgi:hypothetical protein
MVQYVVPVSELPMNQVFTVSTVVQTLVAMVGSLLYLPLQSTAMTVVYFDLRVRSEGLDLALQSAGPSAAQTSTDSPLPEITSERRSAFITGTDVGFFVLLTIGAGVLYVLFVSLFAGLAMFLIPSASGL